jgi:hypothetical protein
MGVKRDKEKKKKTSIESNNDKRQPDPFGQTGL